MPRRYRPTGGRAERRCQQAEHSSLPEATASSVRRPSAEPGQSGDLPPERGALRGGAGHNWWICIAADL
jgi:hypothetical protein